MGKKLTRTQYVGILLAHRDAICEAGPERAGIALMLALYCFREFNGGIMEGAARWTAKRWIFTCGLEAAPVGDCAGLWHWEGEDLLCDLYSPELERQALEGQERNQNAARIRWERQWARAHAEEEAPGAAAWFRALAAAHPAIRLRYDQGLPTEGRERAAVFGAFQRVPAAAEKAELLRAYMEDSRLMETRRGKAFFRPDVPAVFFERLEVVICHAEAWARESGWRKDTERKEKNLPPAAGEDEMEDFREFLRKGGKA